ncbi:hypothetical protein Acr_16g0000300 [Actinidia rufa]|uniref:Uncharacterized protein n=1 Tax=Actinidia rufa TaxID=165716 RepID=A0A7J0FXK6_9ERIC|nr:hypothetical protein Acr_16g0000300 [Actinidia rufa]
MLQELMISSTELMLQIGPGPVDPPGVQPGLGMGWAGPFRHVSGPMPTVNWTRAGYPSEALEVANRSLGEATQSHGVVPQFDREKGKSEPDHFTSEDLNPCSQAVMMFLKTQALEVPNRSLGEATQRSVRDLVLNKPFSLLVTVVAATVWCLNLTEKRQI